MSEQPSYLRALPRDLSASIVVFLVALPLCLGIALASGAPLLSGLVSGIVGGLVVALLSGSHSSVSGPAAGLTAIVVTQIDRLGGFDAFLVAVVLAGALQIAMGVLRAGSLAAFFPSSVIKGLLSAIGIILILKQIPHLFGHDPDWLGDMSFQQIDGENTFSELLATAFHLHPGATVIGLASIALLVAWERTPLKRSPVPGPLVVVFAGVAMTFGFSDLGVLWQVGGAHLVKVPVADSLSAFLGGLDRPDFSTIANPAIWTGAVTVALVASLETLLNIEAVDKLDPYKRVSPPNRELVAQGVGNMTSGLVGGLPMTSVIVRSSVNINSGAQTRTSAFAHGLLLLVMVTSLPGLLNMIPLSCLAAILMVTGFKLATPTLFRQMWSEGWSQFVPFIGTVAAIVMTDLLIGILIGMAIAVVFILQSNLKRPLRQIHEHHAGGEVIRIELANQLSFLNRAMLHEALHAIPLGSQVVLDARDTVYIDPDIGDLLREFEEEIAPAHDIELSMLGFENHYDDAEDRITYVDVSTREIQDRVTPERVLEFLMSGNERFVAGRSIVRDLRRQVDTTAAGQYPLAVVLACMDSRVPIELIFDLGIGDIFVVRVAGNIATGEALGSIEFGCAVAGAKLVVVLGHTRCGAVGATIDLVSAGDAAALPDGCDNLPSITGPIEESVRAERETATERVAGNVRFARNVTELNVRHTMRDVTARSTALRRLVDGEQVMLVGGVYDVESGVVELLEEPS